MKCLAVRCDVCHESFFMTPAPVGRVGSFEPVRARLRELGWRYSVRRKVDVCAKCRVAARVVV